MMAGDGGSYGSIQYSSVQLSTSTSGESTGATLGVSQSVSHQVKGMHKIG